ncbi:hypothetical protein HMI54_004696 [Coelomomyces lativittatus]|nr:hypothetical protein HMI55_007333 [Coelomomyces lativittatus]KAJ1512252.1 hypothetical protein HMI56_004297 [Coelomomyces lativittatus]KAJ1517669.1 hypothetical protein HMI54_004696 [Coelomomyces lativittatus]
MSSFRTSVVEKIQSESAFDVYCKFHPRPSLPLFYLDALDQPIHTFGEFMDLSTTTPLNCPSSVTSGSLIDLHGPSASGKSSVLLHILCTYIAPPYLELPNQDPVPMYGQGLLVLFIDTDLRFDPLRLKNMLYNHFVRCLDGHVYPDTLIPSILQRSLQRVWIATPHDPITFVKIFQHFLQSPWQAPRVDLILIDSFSQFIWPLQQCTGYPLETLQTTLDTCFLQAKLLGMTCIRTIWSTSTSFSQPGFLAPPSSMCDIQFLLQSLPSTNEPDTTIVECTLKFPKPMAPRYIGIHSQGLFDITTQPSLQSIEEG